MKRNRSRLTVFLLGICLLSGSVFGSMSAEAADIQTEGYTEENTEEYTQENSEEAAGDAQSGIVTTDGESSQGQQGISENSWRYQNGELITGVQYRARTVPYPNAWQKVNGVYMNSAGEPIDGAVSKGIDVSEHQGKIDWEKVKADGIDFAILRCGYGNNDKSQDDKTWAYNVSECERLGIPYGVYIYSYAKTTADAKSEAEHVLRLISGRSLTYPVYFDMEDNSTINVSAEVKGQMAQVFCDTISAQGFNAGIYANLNWWTTQLTSPVFENDSWSKWVAQYNVTCDYSDPYDIWQCTSTGKVSGISGNVDVNFWMNENTSGGNSGGKKSGTTLAVRRGNEYHFKYSLADGAADLIINYGYKNDEILVGDWDGDGIDTLCVRRGNTYYFKNSLSGGMADVVVNYGRSSDEVYVGDWNGDGIDTLCVRRGNTYYFKNSLADGTADSVVAYGKRDDIVLTGDWNGSGTDTLCIRRGNTYYIKNSLADGQADVTVPYGRASDHIVVGDWDADGIDTLCVRRSNEYHIKNSIESGGADQIIVYGRSNDVVYAGIWN
ncbi:glycoside hydrolase family 25 protein [Faecalicatena orotica]|uniref:glycoside hydrolase family 25 protein n=1 Tax=Faecalicatena orotica TaxID=1544 RepID=UPI0011B25580|nr:glycoside hydrolase family 25 protein [Faecalicatena orotica]